MESGGSEVLQPREDAPIHVSHWGVDETPAASRSLHAERQENESPAKPVPRMDGPSDRTTSGALAILEDMKFAENGSGGVEIGTINTADEVRQGLAADLPLDDNPTGLQISNRATPHRTHEEAGVATTGSQTSTFTPRRSARTSTSASNSRAGSVTPVRKEPESPTSNAPASTPTRLGRTPLRAQILASQVLDNPAKKGFADGFISSAMPSPSLFQVASYETNGASGMNTSDGSSMPGFQNTSSDTVEPYTAQLDSTETIKDSSEDVDMAGDAGMDVLINLGPHNNPPDVSTEQDGYSSTPLQFPTSTADFPPLFSSPLPAPSLPVISPFRLHQESLPPSTGPPHMATPPRAANDAEDSGDQQALDATDDLQTNEATFPGTSQSIQESSVYANDAMPSIMSASTEQEDLPMMDVDIQAAPHTPVRIRAAEREFPNQQWAPEGQPLIQATPPTLQGSLTPSIQADNRLPQLPFPIISHDPPAFSSILFNSVVNSSTHVATPSRIPIPASRHVLEDAKRLQDLKSGFLSPDVFSPNSTTLQLRQPSGLKHLAGNAASRIPRASRKPYAKPASRLPKPKTVAKIVSPPRSVTSPPLPPIAIPASPIKTRRGRAALASTKPGQPTVTELPPGTIIYQPPPPPRMSPKSASPEVIQDQDQDQDVRSVEIDGEIVSGRASPPAETGMTPPRSGLLLKSQSRRLKQQASATAAAAAAAANASPPPIPEFSATAPSLGIFPALSRPKGKGKNTLIRPMMMPLDPTSLRNLTTSNTLRNQNYVCSMVETQTVIRDGARPASPTTKVKTVLEKRREEQEKSREVRAARRLKTSLTNGEDQEMADADEPEAPRHPRAAGDEEEYTTPVKPERDKMDLDQGNEPQKRKTVKWNKNLLQRLELDETNFEEIKRKAGLARTRSTSRSCIPIPVLLDPLGNVPHADLPVPNLTKEQVVVTRVVYVDELPPSQRPKRAAATKTNG